MSERPGSGRFSTTINDANSQPSTTPHVAKSQRKINAMSPLLLAKSSTSTTCEPSPLALPPPKDNRAKRRNDDGRQECSKEIQRTGGNPKLMMWHSVLDAPPD
jgi:hypothetical protein